MRPVFTELLLLLSEQEGKHVGQQEVKQESETKAEGGLVLCNSSTLIRAVEW